MVGLSLAKIMARSLGLAKTTEQYVEKYYENGGILCLVIAGDKPLKDEQEKKIRDMVTNRHAGIDNAFRTLILGGLKAEAISPEMDEESVSANRQFSISDIARMFRLPAYILGDLSKATWGNIKSLGIELVKYSLANWLTPLEQELTRKLLTTAERKAGIYIRCDVSALLRGDHAAQIDAAIKRVQNGLSTPDEERATWELPPYADGIGSVPRVQLNTVALTPAQPAAHPTDVDDTDQMSKATTVGELLGPLFADAAARVGKKTEKAVEAHRGKDGWTPWANVFAGEQAKYAAEAVGPILDTYSKMTGQSLEGRAKIVGEKYGLELRRHFAAIGRGEPSKAPNLEEIWTLIKMS